MLKYRYIVILGGVSLKSELSIGHNYNFLQTPYSFSYQSSTKLSNWDIFHIHDGMEFLYVHEGSGFAIIDQKIFQMNPGTLVYFQPYQLHGTKVYMDCSSVYTRSILSLDPSEVISYLQPFPALKNFFHMLWKTNLDIQIISTLLDNNPIEIMYSQFNTTITKCSKHETTEEYILFIITFLKYLKSIWPEQIQDNDRNTSLSQSYVEQIMAWIDKNYALEFHLDLLSKELHLSQHYIAHLFHDSTGASITAYLNVRRMRQACWLLKNSTLSVSQVCQNIGLTNVSYFCKKFKEHTGTTPLKYRK